MKRKTPKAIASGLRSSGVVRRLYHEIGNPYTDEGGNLRVHCPECDVRMRLISWPRYVCGKCGSEWDVVR